MPVSDGFGGVVSWDGAREEERVEPGEDFFGARELFGVCICGIRWQEDNLESVSCSGARVEGVCLGLVALIRNSKYRPVKKGVKGAGLSGA